MSGHYREGGLSLGNYIVVVVVHEHTMLSNPQSIFTVMFAKSLIMSLQTCHCHTIMSQFFNVAR